MVGTCVANMIVPDAGTTADPASTAPARAFTAEISLAVMAPLVLMSYLKLASVAGCPARAFTALISLALTDRELLTSPTKNPMEAEAPTAVLFTAGTEMVRLLLSASPVSETVTSFANRVVVDVTGAEIGRAHV